MHLIHCNPPTGELEPAPRCSLARCSAGDEWDGFWGTWDERYYTRLTRADGSEQWFCFADEAPKRMRRGGRVLPFRRQGVVTYSARSTMLVGTWRGARTMLVGTSRRGAPRPPRVAGDRR